MRTGTTLWTVGIGAALSGCVAVSTGPGRSATACSVGSEARAVAQVFFGRNIGDAVGVTDAQWTAFLDQEVTPRFPDGLSVQDAQGQWRDRETGRIVREPSKILTVILDDETRGRADVDAVAAAYKTRFRQQAVGVVIERGCVSF